MTQEAVRQVQVQDSAQRYCEFERTPRTADQRAIAVQEIVGGGSEDMKRDLSAALLAEARKVDPRLGS